MVQSVCAEVMKKVSVSVLVSGVKYILCNVNMRMMRMRMLMRIIMVVLQVAFLDPTSNDLTL